MNFWSFLDRNSEGCFYLICCLLVFGVIWICGVDGNGCSCGPGLQFQIGTPPAAATYAGAP